MLEGNTIKAFNSMDHGKFWTIQNKTSVPQHLIVLMHKIPLKQKLSDRGAFYLPTCSVCMQNISYIEVDLIQRNKEQKQVEEVLIIHNTHITGRKQQ